MKRVSPASPWHRPRARCRRWRARPAAAPSPSSSPQHSRLPPAPAGPARLRRWSAIARRWSSTDLRGNSLPRPVSVPSVSQAISASPALFRKRSIAGKVSMRSTDQGFGEICRSATRAVPAGISVMSRAGLRECDQRDAAAVVVGFRDQFVGGLDAGFPSSTPSSSRRRAGSRPRRCWRRGRWRIPDRTGGGDDQQRRGGSRISVSHHGVREGVSSFGAMSNSSLVGVEFDAARGPRRHHAQQPPQHGQG